ncbi:MAG: fibronectin type III domain-containing protein [Streptosporangiaceae bacterium]
MSYFRRRLRFLVPAAAALTVTTWLTGIAAAQASLPGADPSMTRAPYLTDLTAASVHVSWGTSSQVRGVVEYGPPGSCTANSVTSTKLGNPITINGVREYQNSVAVTGLSAGTTYCYRITNTGSNPVDLLGSLPSPRFTTIAGGSSVTFDVLGDWGDNSFIAGGGLNTDQAGVDAQIANSGAQFAITTGDVAYPGGTQTEYGDLNQTGLNISSVFGPSYWARPGQKVPLFMVSGNHGRNTNFITNWPEQQTAALSGGVYAMVSYPSIDGTTPASYPTSYYAFSAGGVRFYMLDATWSNSNMGSATGGTCGSHCAMYQIDRDAHWTASSAEYRWLAGDLAAHPGGVKLAFFHFPLHSDDSSEPSDTYLDNAPGSSGSLEQLLHDSGVQLVFNGHAHIYQRNIAPPGGVTSYVTGGGGAKLEPVSSHCSTTDAYAIGWSYSSSSGSKCGAAAKPTREAQVHHFLKVTVIGRTVTVTPINSLGQAFDQVTYNFAADATPPTAPGFVAVSQPSPSVRVVTWTPGTDNIGVSAYDIYRNGRYLGTVGPTRRSYTDATATPGTGYSYRVVARDLAGHTAGVTVQARGD